MRGFSAVQKNLNGAYRFAASGPDHKRTEVCALFYGRIPPEHNLCFNKILNFILFNFSHGNRFGSFIGSELFSFYYRQTYLDLI